MYLFIFILIYFLIPLWISLFFSSPLYIFFLFLTCFTNPYLFISLFCFLILLGPKLFFSFHVSLSLSFVFFSLPVLLSLFYCCFEGCVSLHSLTFLTFTSLPHFPLIERNLPWWAGSADVIRFCDIGGPSTAASLVSWLPLTVYCCNPSRSASIDPHTGADLCLDRALYIEWAGFADVTRFHDVGGPSTASSPRCSVTTSTSRMRGRRLLLWSVLQLLIPALVLIYIQIMCCIPMLPSNRSVLTVTKDPHHQVHHDITQVVIVCYLATPSSHTFFLKSVILCSFFLSLLVGFVMSYLSRVGRSFDFLFFLIGWWLFKFFSLLPHIYYMPDEGVTLKRCTLLVLWSCNKLSVWTLLFVDSWCAGKYLRCK